MSHFEEEWISKNFETTMPDGTVQRIERRKWDLKKGAIPTKFSCFRATKKSRKAPPSRVQQERCGNDDNDEQVLWGLKDAPGPSEDASTISSTIWSDFKPQVEGLDKSKFTVVVMDPVGYGKSRPPPRKFDVNFYKKDAHFSSKLMEALGIHKYSVLGWSDGGISGIIQAAAFPESINKLVIWGANAYISDKDMKQYEGIRDTSKWSEKMRTPLEMVYGADGLRDMMLQWYYTLENIFKQGGDICKSDLRKISAPVLILHGDKDPVVPGEHPVFLQENLKNSQLYRFPDGKHNIHLRYATEFNKVVTEFLLSKE